MRRRYLFLMPDIPVRPGAGGLGRVAALMCFLCVAGSAFLVSGDLAANDEITFLGHKVTPKAGTFVVTKDLNVRDEPDTSGKRIGQFQEGDRISVVGSARGSWMAVRVDGKDLGFVYGPVLMPLIDPVVKEPMTGDAEINGGSCSYRAVFEGESPIEGQMFSSADYRAVLECRRNGKSFAFEVPMFITEGPYNGGGRSVHQIGMDVLELAQEYERVFSTNLLYDADKSEVKLDSASVKKYLAKAKPDPVPAKDVASALQAAIVLAVRSWSPEFWTELARALRGSGG